MIDNNQKIQNIIESLTDFTFAFSMDEVRSKMELREVSKEELERLGSKKVKENFINGIFKLKFPDETIIDADSINEYCKINDIKKPILFVNPNQKYVCYELTEDLTTLQIKRHIRRQLANSNEINLDELEKALIEENLKNKEVDGYINKIAVKTSSYVQQGKFYMQSTCSRENAYDLISSEINEIKIEKEEFINRKIHKDRWNAFFYFIFIIVILTLWILNNYYKAIPQWLSTSIGITLYLVSLVVLRFINHSFIKLVFNRKRAESKYGREFTTELINYKDKNP